MQSQVPGKGGACAAEAAGGGWTRQSRCFSDMSLLFLGDLLRDFFSLSALLTRGYDNFALTAKKLFFLSLGEFCSRSILITYRGAAKIAVHN